MAMSDLNQSEQNQPGAAPDPEVRSKPERRRFTAEYKRRILIDERLAPELEQGCRFIQVVKSALAYTFRTGITRVQILVCTFDYCCPGVIVSLR